MTKHQYSKRKDPFLGLFCKQLSFFWEAKCAEKKGSPSSRRHLYFAGKTQAKCHAPAEDREGGRRMLKAAKSPRWVTVEPSSPLQCAVLQLPLSHVSLLEGQVAELQGMVLAQIEGTRAQRSIPHSPQPDVVPAARHHPVPGDTA